MFSRRFIFFAGKGQGKFHHPSPPNGGALFLLCRRTNCVGHCFWSISFQKYLRRRTICAGIVITNTQTFCANLISSVIPHLASISRLSHPSLSRPPISPPSLISHSHASHHLSQAQNRPLLHLPGDLIPLSLSSSPPHDPSHHLHSSPPLHLHLLPPCTNLSITIPLSRLTLSTPVSPLPTHLTASPMHQTSPSPISDSPLSPSPKADPCNPSLTSTSLSSPSASLSVCHLLYLCLSGISQVQIL